ncbi:MAG: hypothetical protein LBV75_03830 [Paludibacter sp.]|jgi:hypothetical protein|nr:hypothetical protein [Paludibacter sp.]
MTYKINHLRNRSYQVIIEGKKNAFQIADYLDAAIHLEVSEVRIGWEIKQITIFFTCDIVAPPETIIKVLSIVLDNFKTQTL